MFTIKSQDVMKQMLLSYCLLFMCSALYCQSAPGFNLRFTNQYPNSQIYKVLVENDTIVTLGIGYKDTISWERGLVLMKLDTFGNLLQASHIPDTLFGGPNPLLLHIRYGSLLKTPDGGYIMNIVPYLFSHLVILKTDHDFNIKFIKEYLVLNEGVDYMQSELKPINNGYLLHGSFKQSNGKADGFVGRINFEGDSIWMKNFGSFESSETVVDVKMIDDSTFAVSMVYNINTGSALSSIKIVNQYGDVLQTWNSVPNPGIGYLREILSADENGYLLYGLYPLEFLPPFDMLVQSTISSLDKDFNVLWSKRYGKEVTLSSEIMFYNFDRTIDGNYIGVGTTSIDQPTTSPLSSGWLMKFSPEGDSIWSRLDLSDLQPVVYTNSHRLGGVGVLSSGSIVAGGYVRKQNDYYAWLIKVTNDGCLDTLYCGLVSGVQEEVPQRRNFVRVFPNPATTYLELDFEAIPSTKIRLVLTNLLGTKLVDFELENSASHHYIPLLGLPNGQYFYSIMVNGQRLQSGKFIKIE